VNTLFHSVIVKHQVAFKEHSEMPTAGICVLQLQSDLTF